MKEKKYLIGGCIVFIIVLLTGLGFITVWGTPDGSEMGFGPWKKHGRGFHCGPGGKDVSDFILWRMEKKVEDLDLSEEQMDEFKAIQTTLKIRINEFIEDRRAMMDAFHLEISKDSPDLELLKGSMKEKISDMSEFMGETIDLLFGFYEGLNEEQKAKVHRDIRNRFEDHAY